VAYISISLILVSPLFIPEVYGDPGITYSPSTNVITVVGYTEASPCTFSDLYSADKSGTRILNPSTFYNACGTYNIASQVLPADDKSLDLWLNITQINVSAGDVLIVNVNGTDRLGNVLFGGKFFLEGATTGQYQLKILGPGENFPYVYETDVVAHYSTVKLTGGIEISTATSSITFSLYQKRWGVVWKESTFEYRFDARIQIGNGTVAGTTWFADTNKNIHSTQGIFTASYQSFIYVKNYANFRIGKLNSATYKTGSDGVNIISDVVAYGPPLYLLGLTVIVGDSTSANIYVYASKITSTRVDAVTGRLVRVQTGATLKVYQTSVENIDLFLSTGTADIFDVHLLEGSKITPYGATTITIDKLYSYDTNYAILFWYYYAGDIKNLYQRGATTPIDCYSLNIDKKIINGDLQNWGFRWAGTNYGKKVYRQYEFDLNVTTSANIPISGANVTVRHYGVNAGQDFTVLTGTNGSFATKTLTTGYYTYTSGDALQDYNPHNLTIVASGYQTASFNFTLNEKIKWKIALLPEIITKTDPVARFNTTITSAYINKNINFDGSMSYDPDGGSITNYEWNFGDSNVTSGNYPTISHKWTNLGSYKINLTVTDDEGAKGWFMHTINITHINPVARFNNTITTVNPNQTVTLDGSMSYDPDGGSITSYSWNFGDGNITIEPSPTITHVWTSAGNYTITLTVTDDEGATDFFSWTIEVVDYINPVARFHFTPPNPRINQQVTFNASESQDPDGIITSFQWDFGDGANATTMIANHTYTSSGTFDVTLTVFDNQGKNGSFILPLNVSSNLHPKARFTYSPSNPQPQETVYFNASASQDYDGYITTYYWTFGDETNATGILQSHNYTSAGTFTVTLTVTDNENSQNSFSQNIVVSIPPTPPTPGPEYIQPVPMVAKTYDLTILVKDQYRYPIEGVEVKLYTDSKLILEGKTDEFGSFIAKRQTAKKTYTVKVIYDNRLQEQKVLLDQDKTLTFEYSLISFEILIRMFERNWVFILLLGVFVLTTAITWRKGWATIMFFSALFTIFIADYTMLPPEFKLFSVIAVVTSLAVIFKSFSK